MKRFIQLSVILFLTMQYAGCAGTVRTSVMSKPRVDQEISGNRGFIFGRPNTPVRELAFKERKIHCVEIELPIIAKDTAATVKGSPAKSIKKFSKPAPAQIKEKITELKTESSADALTYAVQQGDTLQKISQRFYGTTKKWQLLYEANARVLKSADTVYPGQVLVIPGEVKYEK